MPDTIEIRFHSERVLLEPPSLGAIRAHAGLVTPLTDRERRLLFVAYKMGARAALKTRAAQRGRRYEDALLGKGVPAEVPEKGEK